MSAALDQSTLHALVDALEDGELFVSGDTALVFRGAIERLVCLALPTERALPNSVKADDEVRRRELLAITERMIAMPDRRATTPREELTRQLARDLDRLAIALGGAVLRARTDGLAGESMVRHLDECIAGTVNTMHILAAAIRREL